MSKEKSEMNMENVGDTVENLTKVSLQNRIYYFYYSEFKSELDVVNPSN